MKKILLFICTLGIFLFNGNFTQVFSNNTDPIVNIEIGREQTAIITQSGRVFTWGQNFRGLIGNGEFGRDENNVNLVQTTPYEMTNAFNLDEDDKITDVEFGNSYGFALSQKGRIFRWGKGSTQYNFEELTDQLTLNEDEHIARMNFKSGTATFYSNQQRIFAIGFNTFGVLGQDTSATTMTLIDDKYNLNENEIVQLIDLAYNNGTVVTNQRLFKSGTNFNGAMGYDNQDNASTNTIVEPNLVDITSYLGLEDNEYVLKHTMTDHSSLLITSNNRVLTWGNNYYGLVGNNMTRDDHAYKAVDVTEFFELQDNELFVDAVASRSAIIIMTNQRLFMLGNNQYRFGLGSIESRISKPLDITPAFNLAPGEFPIVIDSQASDLMSVGMITTHNNVYMWGNYAEYKMLYYEEKPSSSAMYVTEPVLIQDYFDAYQPPTYNGETTFEYEASDQVVDWKTLIESSVTDNDAQTILVTILEEPTMNDVGTQEVLYRLEDDSGNTRTDTLEVTIVDTTPPVLTSAVDSIRVPSGSEFDYQLTATDNASGEIEIIFVSPTYSIDKIGTYDVLIRAKDASGNVSDTLKITVTVYDKTPPTITLEGDAEIILEIGDVYEELGVIVRDNYSLNLVATIGGDVVDSNTLGTYIITYDASDAEGNLATQVTRTVTVVDTTPPVITLIGDAELTLEAGSTYEELGATFTDNYDANGDAVVGGDVVDSNTLGTYTVTYNVTDSEGNVATQVTRTITVVDTTPPVISLIGEAAITLEVGSTYEELGATFIDNYDVNGDALIGGDTVNTNVVGTYTVTYNVTDSEGNVATQVTRTITVVDTTPPVISLIGDAELTLEVGSTYEELGATFTDNYDEDLTVIISGDVVDTNVEGTYIITYDLIDREGNVAIQVTRTVIVEDTSSPVLGIIIGVLSVSAISAGGAFIFIKKIKPSLKK